ncbi:LysE family translocator [Marinomonas transparens]|uniref:Uncharacterized protein n=1 Tax=Marinomonas transparens TaxID=2795388 RepID=A0A934JUI5_9GAMM|nr:LysE family transporter [Marinomonas transparens]MBJ7537297.1 hypothetical protein [Marinomonas transparens]
MDNYLLYVGVVVATVLLSGQALLLTINNVIQHGLLKTLSGMFGIALVISLVAAISATSLGIILSSLAMAFNAIKIAGAVYLINLGIKMWCCKASHYVSSNKTFARLLCAPIEC